ncbi:MAG: urease accessory protein [Phaeodactylibacter sp.]|uniref:urease accessory protein n=1 Tax=Phaeodactylibacter sp. TaxID=1940289 RepID=UPI0032EC315F
MTEELTIFLAAIIGFTHAFEADHLVAVGNLVTRRDRVNLAMKDGVYWGLGHSSTIMLIGMAVILGRAAISDTVFGYLEATVGLMLVVLGLRRLFQAYQNHDQKGTPIDDNHTHGLAYGVGLVHGLAGSGALILLVLANVTGTWEGLLYLLIFGLSSAAGMLVAAGALSLPFARWMLSQGSLQLILIILSSALCIGYGGYVIFENFRI